mgnify:CR=1 FL=1
MKQVILKKLEITNFKGIRNLEITFDDKITNVCGANGTGKSTLFDAFTWCLFGKNSKDVKKFNVKTLDKNGNSIPKIPHEVTATLMVNNETIRVTRRFNEKWVKKAGEESEQFDGNEEERLWNDVPLKVKEFDEKIAEICDEQMFKLLTNSSFFIAQREDVQRTLLLNLVGDMSNDTEQLSKNYPEILDAITSKTLNDLKLQINEKKKRIKKNIIDIPARIDELQRSISTDIDFDDVEAKYNIAKIKFEEVKKSLYDKGELVRKISSDFTQKLNENKQLKIELENKIAKVKMRLLSDYNNQISDYDILQSMCKDISMKSIYVESNIKDLQSRTQMLNDKKALLYQNWKELKALQFVMPETDYKCPVCGAAYEIEKIEEIEAKALADFNSKKAQKLQENETEGKSINQQIASINEQIAQRQKELDEYNNTLKKNQSNPLFTSQPQKPENIEEMINADIEIVNLKSKIANSDVILKTTSLNDYSAEIEDLKKSESELGNYVEQLNKTLLKRDYIKQSESRISDLQKELEENNKELALLEKKEFQIESYERDVTAVLEQKVNSMFGYVQFKLFEKQVNGAIAECCKATVNGVPIATDVNNADVIKGGLEIIKTIANHMQLYMPVFIDNAESINSISEYPYQVIKLTVTSDPNLTIS